MIYYWTEHIFGVIISHKLEITWYRDNTYFYRAYIKNDSVLRAFNDSFICRSYTTLNITERQSYIVSGEIWKRNPWPISRYYARQISELVL